MTKTLRVLGIALALPIAAAGVTAVMAGSADRAGSMSAVRSQSTGSGAGKVTFNPFSTTRRLDVVGAFSISPYGLV